MQAWIIFSAIATTVDCWTAIRSPRSSTAAAPACHWLLSYKLMLIFWSVSHVCSRTYLSRNCSNGSSSSSNRLNHIKNSVCRHNRQQPWLMLEMESCLECIFAWITSNYLWCRALVLLQVFLLFLRCSTCVQQQLTFAYHTCWAFVIIGARSCCCCCWPSG